MTPLERSHNMVIKRKTGEKKGKVKVGKLKLKKETVKDLTGDEQKRVKGGLVPDLCKATTTCGKHYPSIAV
jgi:hypothetical protein